VTAATTGTTPTRRSPLYDLRREDTDSMDDDNAAPPMRPGQRYQVRYRSGSQRRDRTAVMVYLGEDGDGLLVDARPAAGTQRMPRRWLRAVEPVPADTAAHINRIVR